MTSQHQQETDAVIEQIKNTGRYIGRLIMETVLSTDCDPDQINKGVDAAVADFREMLVAGGADAKDIEVSCHILKSAIIAEGKAIACLLPDSSARLQ